MFAATTITVDPAWPWSLPTVGLGGLALIALLLAALTVWTYSGVKQATPRRLGVVLALRLAALAVALGIVLRPSLAHDDDEDGMLPSKLLVLVDASESMNITDEFNNLSRFENAKRLLTAPDSAALLKRLGTEKRIEVAYYLGGEGIKPLDLAARPQAKRTDLGGWLNELWQQHGGEEHLQGLLLFSDGADNGTRFAAVAEAAKYRGRAPIQVFALGQTTTTAAQKDLAVARVWVEPTPVPAKGKMIVKATLRTPGFDDAVVQATLWMEEAPGGVMKQVGAPQNVDLRRTKDQTLEFGADAPDSEGELKVSVKVEPLPGETNVANNEGSSYVNVSKEGVSILWVEGKLRYEAALAIRTALSKDRRFRVYHATRLQEAQPKLGDDDFLDFDKRHYDVVVIGDISAKRFAEGNPEVFDRLRAMVEDKGTGLVFLGGYDTFAAGGWAQTRLTSLLPARFDEPGQIEVPVKIVPTPQGAQFLLKLSLDPQKNEQLWTEKLDPLAGMTPLGTLDPTATPYAFAETTTKRLPIMASVDRGRGRVLAFGGDTTYQAWRRSPEAIAAYERFWTQMMLWLAKRENSQGTLWVQPDTRRLELGQNERLGFTVHFTKAGSPIQKPGFTAKVIGPNQGETDVVILEENQQQRGYFSGPPAPGEYRIVVQGKGVDEQQQPVEGKDVARFMVYDEDRETQRPAADHELLQKIAQASGGQFALAEERKLLQVLNDLQAVQDAARGTSYRWPDWRRAPASDAVADQFSALWQSSALISFLLFTGLLCSEWLLRRRWGMV